MNLPLVLNYIWGKIVEFNIGTDKPSHNAIVLGFGVLLGIFIKPIIFVAVLYIAFSLYQENKK